MTKFDGKPRIEVGYLKGKGRVVLASAALSKGEIVEKAPASIIPVSERDLLKGTSIFEYYFADPTYYKQGTGDICGYISYGLASMCSHSNIPNAMISWVSDETGVWSTLSMLTDVGPQEEISIYYTNIQDYKNASLFV